MHSIQFQLSVMHENTRLVLTCISIKVTLRETCLHWCVTKSLECDVAIYDLVRYQEGREL